MPDAKQPHIGDLAAVHALLEQIPACSFVAIYPTEPEPYRRQLLEACGVLVGVSDQLETDYPQVFTPAGFLIWAERHDA